MTKYESILNALSASKDIFSEEDLLNLYKLLLRAYAKGTPARDTIWNAILRDPRLSQFKEKLIEQCLREYNEPPSLSRDVDRFSNGPSMSLVPVHLHKGSYKGTWVFREADTDGANPSAPHAHAGEGVGRKHAHDKLNPYTGEICDSKGHGTGEFIDFDDYKSIWENKRFRELVEKNVKYTHEDPVYTNLNEIIKFVDAAIKQGRRLTPEEWEQVRKIHR